MENKILFNLNDPGQLEKLYREDKLEFKRAFNALYPDVKDQVSAKYWYERLNYTVGDISWGNGLVFVIIASILSGIIARLPAILSINEEFFYTRNAGFILFPALTAYFAWKNKLSPGKMGILAGTLLVAVLYINVLPGSRESDTLILACIHLPLVLWAVLGMAFVGKFKNNTHGRLDFLKFNGDLIVMTTLIGIAGAILTGVTIGLFEVIGLDIEEFYFENIVIFILPAAPIIGAYLTQTNPNLVGKVSPVIAKIFSPLVLVMLVIYLIAILYSGQDIYNDREFLLTFNLLLVGVMAIIFFSVAERSKASTGLVETRILFLLSTLTIVINSIALSAIAFRISEWGITPNRAAVLGANILILINLIWVAVQLFKVLTKKADHTSVGNAIARYLPVYVVWALVVILLFPLLFEWA